MNIEDLLMLQLLQGQDTNKLTPNQSMIQNVMSQTNAQPSALSPLIGLLGGYMYGNQRPQGIQSLFNPTQAGGQGGGNVSFPNVTVSGGTPAGGQVAGSGTGSYQTGGSINLGALKTNFDTMKPEDIYQTEKKRTLETEREKAKMRGEQKTTEAQTKATGNLGRVANAIKMFSDYYADSLKEGGSGNWIKNKYGDIATQTIGGSLGENMPGTGKLFGQRAELSLAMVPILTNQNRFMTSIMDYINKSLPQGHEGAKLARNKLEQTLRNQYVTTKVLMRLGIDPDNPTDVAKIDNMSDPEAELTVRKVINLSKAYKLTPKDEKEFNEIKADVLSSLVARENEEKAINYLKKNNAPITDANIKAVNKQFGW